MREAPEHTEQEQEDGQSEPLQQVDVYVEDTEDEQRITYVRKKSGHQQSEPQRTRRVSNFLFSCGYLLLFSVSLFIPSSATSAPEPIVTITLFPQMEHITTTQSVELPVRLLPAFTLSESKTVLTTGKGYQPARKARGTITFYNGQFLQSNLIDLIR